MMEMSFDVAALKQNNTIRLLVGQSNDRLLTESVTFIYIYSNARLEPITSVKSHVLGAAAPLQNR